MTLDLDISLRFRGTVPEIGRMYWALAGMVAAVHVSVTGHSELFTSVTPDGVVRMWPGGSDGFVRGGALLIDTVAVVPAAAADVGGGAATTEVFAEFHG